MLPMNNLNYGYVIPLSHTQHANIFSAFNEELKTITGPDGSRI